MRYLAWPVAREAQARLEPEIGFKVAGGRVRPDDLETIDGETCSLRVVGEGGGEQRPGGFDLQLGYVRFRLRPSAGRSIMARIWCSITHRRAKALLCGLSCADALVMGLILETRSRCWLRSLR